MIADGPNSLWLQINQVTNKTANRHRLLNSTVEASSHWSVHGKPIPLSWRQEHILCIFVLNRQSKVSFLDFLENKELKLTAEKLPAPFLSPGIVPYSPKLNSCFLPSFFFPKIYLIVYKDV